LIKIDCLLKIDCILFFDIRKNWKSCINSNYQVENGILFSPTQLFELYDYLYKDAYNHNILDLNDQYKIINGNTVNLKISMVEN